jgi:uncharacterized membrane protein YfcA
MLEIFAEELGRASLIPVAAAAMVAGFVRGMAGFGAALVLTPVFSAFYGPAVAIPTLGLADLTVGLPLALRSLGKCVWREVLPLALAAMATLPLGGWILATADGRTLRIVMSILILLAVAAMWSGWRYARTPGLGVTLAVGGAAGIMGGAVGMSGPPVVLFWLGGKANAALARTNTLAFFFVASFATQATYFIAGLMTWRVLALAILLLPLYGGGLWLGARTFHRISERLFRIIAFSLIGAISLATLVVALFG